MPDVRDCVQRQCRLWLRNRKNTMYNKVKKRENVPESRHAADLKSDVRIVFSVPEDLDIPKQRSESSSCRGKELVVRGCTLSLY